MPIWKMNKPTHQMMTSSMKTTGKRTLHRMQSRFSFLYSHTLLTRILPNKKNITHVVFCSFRLADTEPKFIAFYSVLVSLFSLFCFDCKAGSPRVNVKIRGTMAIVNHVNHAKALIHGEASHWIWESILLAIFC